MNVAMQVEMTRERERGGEGGGILKSRSCNTSTPGQAGAAEHRGRRGLTHSAMVSVERMVLIEEDVLVLGRRVGQVHRVAPWPHPSSTREAHGEADGVVAEMGERSPRVGAGNEE